MAGADAMPAAADVETPQAIGQPPTPQGITSDCLALKTSAVTGKDATDGSTPDATAAAEAVLAVANGDAAVAAGQEAAADETAGQTATAGSAGEAAGPQTTAAATTASAQAAADPELATHQQPLSKNQQKKLRKMQR